jgi:Methyltransferase domain/Rv2258c-like winged HTH domain
MPGGSVPAVTGDTRLDQGRADSSWLASRNSVADWSSSRRDPVAHADVVYLIERLEPWLREPRFRKRLAIVTELGAALGVLLTSLGTRSGLWAALAGAGPLTTADMAAKVSVEPSLAREWLRAQAAGGYLDYDAAQETFTLPDAVAADVHYGPGGALIDACAIMLSSMGEGFAAFSEAFSAGQGFGWHQRTADHWHGLDAFTRVVLPAELIEAAIGQMAGLAAVLTTGGTVADIGCGYGAPTLSIAGLYPSAQVLGVDYHDASIAHSRAEAAAGGVSNVRFEVAAAADLPGKGYDLITFFDSLHDIGDPSVRWSAPVPLSHQPERCCCSSRWAPTTSRTTSTRTGACSTPSPRSHARRTRCPSRQLRPRNHWIVDREM